MNHFILAFGLVLSSGCGGGDDAPPGDGPGGGGTVERRAVFAATATQGTQLTFDNAAEVQAGDQLIAVIEADVDQIELVTMSSGWTLLADDLAVMCTGMFHVWLLARTATTDAANDFTFDTPASFTAIITAYANARDVELMDFKLMGELRNMPINFSAATIAPDSVVWVGGGGQANWTDLDAPVGMNLVLATNNAAAYQLPIPDGNVPAIELPNDNGFCADVAQISVEP